MSLQSHSSIAVIGGSLVGPLVALLFAQAGFENVQVYESTPAAVPQAGGVIGLDLVSLDVLDSVCIDQRRIIPFESERVVSIKVLDRREVGRIHTIYPGRNTTWTLLHRALIEQLPSGSFHTGKRLTGLSENEDGRALLEFADGEQVVSEFVAFADGRKSTGRKLLDPTCHLSYAGYVAARGQAPFNALGAFDFTRYEPGVGQFNVFPIALDGGSIGLDWTLYVNTPAERFQEWFGASPTRRTFVLPHQISQQAKEAIDHHASRILTPAAAELVHGTRERMAAPIVDIGVPSQMVYPIAPRGWAVLLGDALAPVRPHTAKGANLGIEQAKGLTQALRQHLRYGADLDAALNDWQNRHLPHVLTTLQRGPEMARRFGLGEAQLM